MDTSGQWMQKKRKVKMEALEIRIPPIRNNAIFHLKPAGQLILYIFLKHVPFATDIHVIVKITSIIIVVNIGVLFLLLIIIIIIILFIHITTLLITISLLKASFASGPGPVLMSMAVLWCVSSTYSSRNREQRTEIALSKWQSHNS